MKKQIREYTEHATDSDLKELIIKRVEKEENRGMLDSLYQTLEKSQIDQRIATVLGDDGDAKSQLDRFARIILDVPGTYQEKHKFIEDYPAGFVDIPKLTTTGTVQKFTDLFVQVPFVQRVAMALMPIVDQGIGPSEYAFSILSPDVSNSGRLQGAPGDLQIGGKGIEVKGQKTAKGKTSGGRFADGRKALVDVNGAKQVLVDAGVQDVPKRINLAKYMELLERFPEEDRLQICTDTLSHIIKHTEYDALAKVMVSGNVPAAKREYIRTVYVNYKRMAGFHGMLMVDVTNGRTLYYTDIDTVLDVINHGTIYIITPDQMDPFPQMKF